MSHEFAPDIEHLLQEQMSTGLYNSTDDLMRDALQVIKTRNDDLAALKAGLDDMEAGRVEPFMDAANEIARKHGLMPE